ncbi:heme-dependent peroxidase [Kyrpidia spormannii]|uniref:Coproheme decarboxylase n=1 Tax=Kyrpidia spormannii TaxID=2055160 RepID=A0A2K8N745_9BACL|nr:hydrogen peroxide-dependent heme synthase [Kyrpidia spormannii]ATY85181.1 heme-dependent peroxidase [Kyrpidia spormannii]
MSEAVQTLEGWFALHDFRHIDWPRWAHLPADERRHMRDAFLDLVARWDEIEATKQGSTALYTVVGQKADLVMVHLRPTLQDLEATELVFERSEFATLARPAYSYVSVVELSNYTTKPGTDPSDDPVIQRRLKPILPKTEHICFYPMNKRRQGEDNWYMLDMEDRRTMMRSHGEIGRRYGGKVTQIITGSVGLDDWEWGVTLFADDPIVFKKLIYEMRFDEVSARFGEFGQFFVGNRLTRERIDSWLGL